MALESYRRQRVISNSANADFDQVIMLNAGDVDGRIVRFEAAKGNGRAATACKLWIDKGEGLAVFCELIRVDMPTPTWEAAIPVRGLDVGVYNAAIRLEDVDGSITETMPIRVQVVGSILAESEATEEMQDALDDFEIRTRAALADIAEAITEAETATTDAQTATTEATEAAQAANTAAQNIGAEVDAQGILTVTDADGTVTTYSGAATAAQSATSAAERATDAAVSAETAAGNIGAEVDSSGVVTVTDADGSQTEFSGLADAVLLARGAAERADDAAIGANAAKDSANSAALSANSAAQSATSAAETATGAAGTATSAATSANAAATSATSAANAANSAANSATSAASSANSAATSATNAATAATTATTNANTATTNANAATTAATSAAQSATDAATAANAAAEDADDAATEARDAAAAALASVGNIVLGEISMLDGAIETVDDAFVSPLRGIEVEGKSTQASVAGNQLYKPFAYTTTNHNVDAVTSLDGTIAVSGTSNGNAYSIEVPDATAGGYYSTLGAGEYTLSGASAECPLQIVVDGVAKYNTTSTQTFALEQQSNVIIRSFIASGRTVDTMVKPMLNSGSTALPWEPYVGGIPSPNPDFPQPIHSVAGAVLNECVGKNLFNPGAPSDYSDPSKIVSVVGGTVKMTVSQGGNNCVFSEKKFSGGQPYAIFEHMAGRSGYWARMFVRLRSDDDTRWLANSDLTLGDWYYSSWAEAWYRDGSPDTFGRSVAIPSCGYANFGIGVGTGSTEVPEGDTVDFYDIQVERGTSITAYEPYVAHVMAPVIPEGVEPLRSLPGGIRDELIVHEDGSGEIVRRVAVVDLSNASFFYGGVTGETNWGGMSTCGFTAYSRAFSALQGHTFAQSNSPICAMSDHFFANSTVSVYNTERIGMNSYLSNETERNRYIAFRVSRSLLAEYGSDNSSDAANINAFRAWLADMTADGTPVMISVPIDPYTEQIPSMAMPDVPTETVDMWLDSKDEDGELIATDSSAAYERSMQIVIDRLEQAIADI